VKEGVFYPCENGIWAESLHDPIDLSSLSGPGKVIPTPALQFRFGLPNLNLCLLGAENLLQEYPCTDDKNLRKALLGTWKIIMTKYAPRFLTLPSDKLPAISGIMEALRSYPDSARVLWSYHRGLFKNLIPESLL